MIEASARNVHIAYVCADRGVPIGGHKGASLHVAELVRALGERGAAVHILGMRVAETAGATLCGADITDVGGSRSARHAREAVLRAHGAEQSPAQATEAAAVLFNQDLARALERLHKQWRIDAVYERYSLWSFAAAGFARAHGVPYLLEVNAPLRDEQKRYRSLENPALAASLEHYIFSCADRLMVPSSILIPYVTTHGTTKKAARVVPNAADPARFRPELRRKAAASKTCGEFVIGFVGSLKPWHGLGDLARVFRRLHRGYGGYRLLVVGDGPLRAELEEELRRYGLLDAVTMTGAADHDRVPEHLAMMDVALAPYPRDAPTYFSPIKIFEYMAAGVPIVASRAGQIAELLSHRRTAMLHRPGAIGEIAASIDELRRRPALADKLARQARQALVRGYTWKRNATRVLTMIGEVRREQARAAAKTQR
ncbi:MAG: glycosyltransferase family 4 protein [Deltaproteobacteria bacterium]|nr:glycosyltransferase family 4 protein [Deltaproteobacteria bacterium]